MLVELLVENYAVVEQARIRFHAGLNLLTGETGSGKSIVVDALGLLFGARASLVVPHRIQRDGQRADAGHDGQQRQVGLPVDVARPERQGEGGDVAQPHRAAGDAGLVEVASE